MVCIYMKGSFSFKKLFDIKRIQRKSVLHSLQWIWGFGHQQANISFTKFTEHRLFRCGHCCQPVIHCQADKPITIAVLLWHICRNIRYCSVILIIISEQTCYFRFTARLFRHHGSSNGKCQDRCRGKSCHLSDNMGCRNQALTTLFRNGCCSL